MTRLLRRAVVLGALGGLLVAVPAAHASIDPGSLLDPVQSLLPSAAPTPTTPVDPVAGAVTGAVQGVAGKTPSAPGVDGGTNPIVSGAAGGPETSVAGGAGAAAGNVVRGTRDTLSETGSKSRGLPNGPARDEDSGPISRQVGTLASNAAALARPLSVPLGLAAAAIAALLVATRRPRRIAKLDDEGPWGHGQTTWRL